VRYCETHAERGPGERLSAQIIYAVRVEQPRNSGGLRNELDMTSNASRRHGEQRQYAHHVHPAKEYPFLRCPFRQACTRCRSGSFSGSVLRAWLCQALRGAMISLRFCRDDLSQQSHARRTRARERAGAAPRTGLPERAAEKWISLQDGHGAHIASVRRDGGWRCSSYPVRCEGRRCYALFNTHRIDDLRRETFPGALSRRASRNIAPSICLHRHSRDQHHFRR